MPQEAAGTGEAHPFIIPLTKIDVERRLVIGTAAEEVADKAGEIMDYTSARPAFESWSKEFTQATGGLSKGNLRVMHTKTVAGRLDDIAFDDDAKRVQIVAKVSDANEWQKVLDGAYTGFSIGGGYAKRWTDPVTGAKRYTPKITEISLVDNPCMHGAKFAQLIKANGIVEQIELRGQVRTFADLRKIAPVTFADAWAGRPRTFAELAKAGLGKRYDATKHPREHDGQFASKTSEKVGRTVLGAAGAIGGGYLGLKHGADVGHAIGRKVGVAANKIMNSRIGPKTMNGMFAFSDRYVRGAGSAGRALGGKYGVAIGAGAIGLGGYLAGSFAGAGLDTVGRRRRAKKAGKLEQYERLNAGVSVVPNKKGQVKRAIGATKTLANKASNAHAVLKQVGLA